MAPPNKSSIMSGQSICEPQLISIIIFSSDKKSSFNGQGISILNAFQSTKIQQHRKFKCRKVSNSSVIKKSNKISHAIAKFRHQTKLTNVNNDTYMYSLMIHTWNKQLGLATPNKKLIGHV